MRNSLDGALSQECMQASGEECKFQDDFCLNQHVINTVVEHSREEYFKKLETKLAKLQNQKNNPCARTMLKNLKEQREQNMNELMNDAHVTMDTISVESPSFFDKLYSTNSLYRHLNPQQALDTSEKEPFVQHDQLANQR